MALNKEKDGHTMTIFAGTYRIDSRTEDHAVDEIANDGRAPVLTFVCGWRGIDRDRALIAQRNAQRPAIFFVEERSNFPDLLPDAPIIDVWRHGRVDFTVEDAPETIIRLNHDTDYQVLARAVMHVLLSRTPAQLILTYDAYHQLYRLLPALRNAEALVAANERLDAPVGDRVLFTRGGSFSWRDYVLETKTAQLRDAEVLDAGIVSEEAMP
jgi:hypothetical protein